VGGINAHNITFMKQLTFHANGLFYVLIHVVRIILHKVFNYSALRYFIVVRKYKKTEKRLLFCCFHSSQYVHKLIISIKWHLISYTSRIYDIIIVINSVMCL
jgi:hypothetical protein